MWDQSWKVNLWQDWGLYYYNKHSVAWIPPTSTYPKAPFFFKQGHKNQVSEERLAKWGHLHTSIDPPILHLGGKWHIRGSIFVKSFEPPKLQTN